MFFLEPSLLVGRLLVFPGFGLEGIVSSPTVPQRAFTLPNVCLYRSTAEILFAWKCGGGGLVRRSSVAGQGNPEGDG